MLPEGLNNNEIKLRIATLCAMTGVNSNIGAKFASEHLKKTTDDFEIFACGLVLYQYNNPEGKQIIDKAFSDTDKPNPEYFEKLKFLDFNKARVYFEQFSNSTDPEIKKKIISMIEDNRGIELIKFFLKDSDTEVANRAIEQVLELGSRSTLEIIKELIANPILEKNAKLALAVFGEKEAQQELEDRVRKGSLQEETLDDLRILGLIHDQNVSEILDSWLELIDDLTNLRTDELKKLNKAIQILIKYGKMSSIPVLSRYCNLNYLENEYMIRWEISCNSAAAVLCIVERNTTYYTLHKKIKE